MSPHERLLGLVRDHLAWLPVEVNAEACLECLRAAPPEDVPGGTGMEGLARAFVHAFACGSAAGLPPGLASHLEDWLHFPSDPTDFLTTWWSSCSVAEVAHRLGTDPDNVLYLADGLRKRGVSVSATPGVKWAW